MKEYYSRGIFGSVCGDIIGSSYESAGYQTKDWDFELFTPFSRFTDDTVMTCAVAKWLLEDPKHTHRSLVEQMQWLGQDFVIEAMAQCLDNGLIVIILNHTKVSVMVALCVCHQ